jgi:hypothetical protein
VGTIRAVIGLNLQDSPSKPDTHRVAGYFIQYGSIAIGLLLLDLLITVHKAALRGRYVSRERLLTPAELEFFYALTAAIPNWSHVCPKVRLADVIDCAKQTWNRHDFARIAQKHLDFIVMDSDTGEVVVAIELDDCSHRLARRHRSDEFVDKALARAEVTILRVKASRYYDLPKLRKALDLEGYRMDEAA